MVCIILTKHGGERERPNYFSTEISSKWFLLVREVCVCWWHPVVPVVVTFSKFVSPRVASGSVPMATCGSVVNVNSLRQIPEEEKRGQNSMIMLVLSCLRWQDGWKEVLEVLPVSLAFGWWIECLVLHMRFEVGGGGGGEGGTKDLCATATSVCTSDTLLATENKIGRNSTNSCIGQVAQFYCSWFFQEKVMRSTNHFGVSLAPCQYYLFSHLFDMSLQCRQF